CPRRPGPRGPRSRRRWTRRREGVRVSLDLHSVEDGDENAADAKSRLATVWFVDDLYREQILEHYKRPHNFGKPERFDLEYSDTNPFCGDEQHVYLVLDEDGRVADARFEGSGCAISTAATSMLTDELSGM